MHSTGWPAHGHKRAGWCTPAQKQWRLPTCCCATHNALTCGGVELCRVSHALVGVGAEWSVDALGSEGCRGAEKGAGIRPAHAFRVWHPQQLQVATWLGCHCSPPAEVVAATTSVATHPKKNCTATWEAGLCYSHPAMIGRASRPWAGGTRDQLTLLALQGQQLEHMLLAFVLLRFQFR